MATTAFCHFLPSGVEVGRGYFGGGGGVGATTVAGMHCALLFVVDPGVEKDATGRLRSRKDETTAASFVFFFLDFGVVVGVEGSTFEIVGVEEGAFLGFAKGSEVSGFLLRFFLLSCLLFLGVSVDWGVLGSVISPGAANISSVSVIGAAFTFGDFFGVAFAFALGVGFAFGTGGATGGRGGVSSSLSELRSDDEVEMLLLMAALSEGLTCANLQESPFLHPAGERKKAHGGVDPSPGFL